jgi:hypothetical protein
MKDTILKILVFSIPPILSLLWFFYWIAKIRSLKRKLDAEKRLPHPPQGDQE